MDNKRWSIVVASSSALVASQGPINVFATGIFIKPISQELGFGRGDIATAIGISSVMTAVASPVFGRMIDRFGVRTPLAISIVLFALATAALSLLPGSVFGLYAMFALTGLVAIGQTPGSYSKVVAAWFDRQRGFALGVVLAGVGIGLFTKASLTNELSHPDILTVLDDFVQGVRDVSLVWPKRRFVPARVRRVTDFFAKALVQRL